MDPSSRLSEVPSAQFTSRVNGRAHQLKVDVRTTLLDALREHLRLSGTKKGCDWSAEIASFICGTRGARPVAFGDVPFAGVSSIRSREGSER